MRPSTLQSLLEQAVKDLIRGYTRECGVRPSKLAQSARLSTQMTHQLASPTWQPSLKTLGRLFDALPDEWQARLGVQYARRAPIEVRLPASEASRHFAIAAVAGELVRGRYALVRSLTERVEPLAGDFVLFASEKRDFRVCHLGHAAPAGRLRAGALLGECVDTVSAEFLRFGLRSAILAGEPILALVQRPEADQGEIRLHACYELRIPVSIQGSPCCLLVATARMLVDRADAPGFGVAIAGRDPQPTAA